MGAGASTDTNATVEERLQSLSHKITQELNDIEREIKQKRSTRVRFPHMTELNAEIEELERTYHRKVREFHKIVATIDSLYQS